MGDHMEDHMGEKMGTLNTGDSTLEVVHPSSWAPTKGYSAGMVSTARPHEARHLFVAGQIGWSAEQVFETDDFIEQFTFALDNVLSVVEAAGGRPEHIAEMTVYVTDLNAYRTRARELGPVWRERLGRHYPAMALVCVAGLVEERAQVEIQARAVLPPLSLPPSSPTPSQEPST